MTETEWVAWRTACDRESQTVRTVRAWDTGRVWQVRTTWQGRNTRRARIVRIEQKRITQTRWRTVTQVVCGEEIEAAA
jgi:hypothetical protein